MRSESNDVKVGMTMGMTEGLALPIMKGMTELSALDGGVPVIERLVIRVTEDVMKV